MAAKKKGGGGKLARSEVVTIRLDPKLRFAAELAARKQRRTLSSFIEWAIEKTVSNEVITERDFNGNGDTALQAMTNIWDVEEADRFIKFAEKYPELLNFDEERLWKLIKETPYFFDKIEISHCSFDDRYVPNIGFTWAPTSHNIFFKRVREQWNLLNSIISGEETVDALPPKPENEIIVPF